MRAFSFTLLLTALLTAHALLETEPEAPLLPRTDDLPVLSRGNTVTQHLLAHSKRSTEYYRRVSQKRHRFDLIRVPGKGDDNEGYDGAGVRAGILGSCAHRGEVRCPGPGGLGSECVFVASDVQSCGGCTRPDIFGFVDGSDCTARPHVKRARCVQGECQIRACERGYELVRSSHDLAGFECVEKS